MCTEGEQHLHDAPGDGGRAMSTAIITDRMNAIVNAERKRGEQDSSTLERVCRLYDLPFWTLENIRKGRAKTIPLDLLDQLGTVWLAVCDKQLRRWEQELATERAKGFGDDILDLEREAANLRTRLEARRARHARRGRTGVGR